MKTKAQRESSTLSALEKFNHSLGTLREEFHRTGRFDDANTKLDEIAKLLFMKVEEERKALEGEPYKFSLDYLSKLAEKKHGGAEHIASAMRDLFLRMANKPEYRNPDGSSIFGATPSLNIQPTDDAFATKIVDAINKIDLLDLSAVETKTKLDERFDVLNEAFGHFVRDSFRHTKEDAQYMTPAEVVSAMTSLAFADIVQDDLAMKRLMDPQESFLIVDPTCGVGTFLVAGLRKALQVVDNASRSPDLRERLRTKLLKSGASGQDKVDRMIRLARLNLLFAGADPSMVVQGNSVLGTSALDRITGEVDLILTNPPFGAEFFIDELLEQHAVKYPMLHDMYRDSTTKRTIVSEIALLDRCIDLLRPGGRLLIVLPDNISSGKGIHTRIREWIGANTIPRAVIGLPTVTFAQAGTRTKTIVLYVQKPDPRRHTSNNYIFMGVCQNIGYDVVNRSGTPVKRSSGENDLPLIVDAYARSKDRRQKKPFNIVSDYPPAVWIRDDQIVNGRWSPGFYQPRRLLAIKSLESTYGKEFDLVRLGDLADFISRKRKSVVTSSTTKCISVKHCNEDGTINWLDVENYNPKWPGIECQPGEVLFSKINPRIRRVCVVPQQPYQVTCSNEFEIITPRGRVGPFVLSALLRSPLVHNQIVSLAAGTSASHKRIKDVELREVLIPVPRAGTVECNRFESLERALEKALASRYKADEEIRSAYLEINDYFQGSAESHGEGNEPMQTSFLARAEHQLGAD